MVPLRDLGPYVYEAIFPGYASGFLRTSRGEFRHDDEKRKYCIYDVKPVFRKMVVESLGILSKQQVHRRSCDRGRRYVAGSSRGRIPGIRMGFFSGDGEYPPPIFEWTGRTWSRPGIGLSRCNLEEGLQTLLEGYDASPTGHGIAGLSPDLFEEKVGDHFFLFLRIVRCDD